MAAGLTYTPIANYTATGSASSYTFTSIPQTYTDLILVFDIGYSSLPGTGYPSGRVGSSNVIDTGSNYSFTYLNTDGTTVSSSRSSNSNFWNPLSTVPSTSARSIVISHFMNYSSTNMSKTILTRSNQVASGYGLLESVALWRSTNAINTIQIYDYNSYNFGAGSVISLYGIAAA